ncbi:hypothetical protein [Alcanivorax sp.]|uniref:hypothetical protein n=1 Tax=Alcanivorax sp. TaxID=1872427 RepID=UPI00258C93F2|nr:hypothetical protein [Alcanivorax sp.]
MSKTTSPKALLSLLSGHPALSALVKEARKVPAQEKDDPLDCLPPALRERVALVEDQHRWLAITETSATAQLLRFHLPKLQQAMPGEQIKIVVGGKRQPMQSNRHAKETVRPHLAQESAQHIEAVAEAIEDDALKASLLRLASRGEPDK